MKYLLRQKCLCSKKELFAGPTSSSKKTALNQQLVKVGFLFGNFYFFNFRNAKQFPALEIRSLSKLPPSIHLKCLYLNTCFNSREIVNEPSNSTV